MPQSQPAIAQAPRVPRDAAELNALRLRREELREQLESVTEWRGELVQERHNAAATNNVEVVRELDGRIRELGERSTRIERSMLQADDAIAQALANGVTDARAPRVIVGPTPPRIPDIPGMPMRMGGGLHGRDVAVVALGEALLFALLGVYLWRVAFRRGLRSAHSIASGQRDVSQLQQSVDAIAVEIERISENQRFVTKLLNEKGERAPASEPRDR